jgi:NAD(P)-dependent dehydrogenase (short-subunit alcohol dehydrogenase family)
MPLENQIAIVTGGSRGYGAGIAEVLQQRGARVWITGRDETALRAVAQRTGTRWVRADVTVPKDWDRLFQEVLAAAGRLDILVNNAGAGITIKPLAEQTDEQIERSIAVNLTGALFGCRRAAEVMQRQGAGTIINISSVCARQAWPGCVALSLASQQVRVVPHSLSAASSTSPGRLMAEPAR